MRDNKIHEFQCFCSCEMFAKTTYVQENRIFIFMMKKFDAKDLNFQTHIEFKKKLHFSLLNLFSLGLNLRENIFDSFLQYFN